MIFRTMHNTSRASRRTRSYQPDSVVEIERAGGAKFEDVRELVAGTRGAGVLDAGDMDAGIWSAGQTQGLIHDIPTCKDLVERLMREAEAIIRGRLETMLSPDAAKADDPIQNIFNAVQLTLLTVVGAMAAFGVFSGGRLRALRLAGAGFDSWNA